MPRRGCVRAQVVWGPACLLLLFFGLGLGAVQQARVVRLTDDGLEKQRPGWSADGHRLTFSRHEADGTQIWQYVVEPNHPGTLKRLTERKAPEYNGVFSPDGKRLLLVINNLSGTQGLLDIATVPADGGEPKTIVGGEGPMSQEDWPAFSPDGKRFAFTSTRDGNQEVYVADIDGSNAVRLTQSPAIDAHPAWSADGTRIAFATDRWGGLEIASVKPDGSGLTRLTQSPGLDDYPTYSPDGRWLAFVSNRDGQYEVYVARPDGSNPTNLTRHPRRDTYPCWRPDSKAITFVSDREGGTDLYTQPLEGSSAER